MDAFVQCWRDLGRLLYANPPFSLIGRVLSKLATENSATEILLVVPEWRGATWMPGLIQLSIDLALLLGDLTQVARSGGASVVKDSWDR